MSGSMVIGGRVGAAVLGRPYGLRAARPSMRLISSTSATRAPRQTVQLAYERYEPPKGKKAETDAGGVVLCHGLFGSKQNWRSLAKATAQRLGVPTFAVDLRNHGTTTPHCDSMAYDEMAADVARFFDDHGIRNAALVGHSMGGKAVQSMALSKEVPDDYIRYLVSVDMSPARGPLSAEFERYVQAMVDIDKTGCKSRQEADEILKEVEPDLGIRQFLLTNLSRAPDADAWTFRIPTETIQSRLHQISDFPYDDERGVQKHGSEQRPTARWDGKTLFVKGAKSRYINRKNLPICDAFFPNAQHVTLDTGHWVQAEQPREFVDELVNFIT